MGVRMTSEELATHLDHALTGTLTSLRKDGRPVTLPMWFVVIDGHIHVRTRSESAKTARMRQDARVCFTVERGVAWPELAAAVIAGDAIEVSGDAAQLVEDAMADRYRDLGVPGTVPEATRRHYDTGSAYFRIVPDEDPITWDNRKLLAKR